MNSIAARAYFMSHRGIFDQINLLCALPCALICHRFTPCAPRACHYRINALQLRHTRHRQQGACFAMNSVAACAYLMSHRGIFDLY